MLWVYGACNVLYHTSLQMVEIIILKVLYIRFISRKSKVKVQFHAWIWKIMVQKNSSYKFSHYEVILEENRKISLFLSINSNSWKDR